LSKRRIVMLDEITRKITYIIVVVFVLYIGAHFIIFLLGGK